VTKPYTAVDSLLGLLPSDCVLCKRGANAVNLTSCVQAVPDPHIAGFIDKLVSPPDARGHEGTVSLP